MKHESITSIQNPKKQSMQWELPGASLRRIQEGAISREVDGFNFFG
jgi:hypothetical protein